MKETMTAGELSRLLASVDPATLILAGEAPVTDWRAGWCGGKKAIILYTEDED